MHNIKHHFFQKDCLASSGYAYFQQLVHAATILSIGLADKSTALSFMRFYPIAFNSFLLTKLCKYSNDLEETRLTHEKCDIDDLDSRMTLKLEL